jgi:hypothetical protein
MIRQILALGAAASLMSCADPEVPAVAEQPAGDAGGWKHPMTPWGEPDLQGMWPLSHLIGTPFERPVEFGERRLLTDEEFAKAQATVQARNESFSSRAIPAADDGQAQRMTSLLIDPPDGRFPELTELGKALQDKMGSSYKPNQTVFDSIADFDHWDRCITRGLPVSMLPRNYNNGIQIIQAPGYVVLSLEMAHEARVIPTDGRPPLEPQIKQWLGEPRGHWEGNTLVVETTNFNGLTGTTNAGVPGSPRPLHPSTQNMRFVERFTRVDDETIEYEMTVIDPDVLTTGSWSAAYPMKLDNSYVSYEYACHEGNTAIRNYIETSRFERAQKAAP